MKDFIEIMSFHGFDMDKSNEDAKQYPPVIYTPELIAEEMKRVGLEKMQPESL